MESGQVKASSGNFLSKTQNQNRDTILEKNVFQAVGGNSFFEIDPPIVKFAGYELNKINKLVVRVINKSPVSQRIHVMPMSSKVFSLHLDKKGVLSTGMGQAIEILFKPTEYKYYNETLKINTESDNFLVPIHAYPVLNTASLREVIPKQIDFGYVDIGSTESNVYPITNKIPLDFQFEFEYLKECSNIVVEPMNGVIPGLGTVEINVRYAPTSRITESAELLLKISQFDFQPMSVRIVGTGRQFDKKKSTIKSIRVKPGSAEIRKDQRSQTPLANQTMSPNQQLMQNSIKRGRSSLKGSMRPSMLQSATLMDAKLSVGLGKSKVAPQQRYQQKEFLDQFNEVQELDKQKDIRFYVYNGDKPMTKEDVEAHQSTVEAERKDRLKRLEESSCNRFQAQFNKDQPIIDKSVAIARQPTFNLDSNDEMVKRSKLLKKLMEVGSKIMIRNRMVARLKKINIFLEGCTSREQVAIKVQQDCNTADQRHSGGDDYIKFQFSMTESTFKPSTFPLQFGQTGPLSDKPFTIEAQTSFDDLTTINLLERSQVDAMGYTVATQPLGFIHLPKETPSLRTSAEEEQQIRGTCLPTIQPIKRSLVFQLPILLPSHIFIAEDPDIKRYKEPTEDEKDLNYMWEDTAAVEDEVVGWSSGDRQVLKYRFMRNLGCQLLTQNGFVNSQIDYDVGNYARIQHYCPRNLQTAEPDDVFSDADSDNDDYPQIQKIIPQELSKKTEGDAKQLKVFRQSTIPINKYKKNLNNMEKNAKQIKSKMLAWHVTTNTQLNKWTNDPVLKKYI